MDPAHFVLLSHYIDFESLSFLNFLQCELSFRVFR